jgi:hypothetical protein
MAKILLVEDDIFSNGEVAFDHIKSEPAYMQKNYSWPLDASVKKKQDRLEALGEQNDADALNVLGYLYRRGYCANTQSTWMKYRKL